MTIICPFRISVSGYGTPIVNLDKEFSIFHKSFNPKVNVIARMEFKLTYFEAVVQHISFYTTETLPCMYVCMYVLLSMKNHFYFPLDRITFKTKYLKMSRF